MSFSIILDLAIILLRKRELVALLLLSWLPAFSLFLIMPWVGLQSVIVVFPGHTHSNLFEQQCPYIILEYLFTSLLSSLNVIDSEKHSCLR